MWTPHWDHAVPPWMEGMQSMDMDSPSAGSPLAPGLASPGYSPASGMMSFGSTPLAPSTLPNADVAAQACHQAPALECHVQGIGLRVQKLERSRGQISKDLADMLTETYYLQKRAGIVDDTKAHLMAGSKGYDAESIVQDAGPPGLEKSRRGSRIKTAPASGLPQVPEGQPLLAKSQTERICPPPGLALQLPESFSVKAKEIDGVQGCRVEWRIDGMKTKFKDCLVRPLVSPQFEAGGLPELRLMVFPNLGDIAGLTMREQKSRYEARIAEGPLNGALKFKVVTDVGDSLAIKFKLFIGNIVQGPMEHNFADHVIAGFDFSNNWLDLVQGGSLLVGVEIIAVNGIGAQAAAEAAKALA
eukprot:gb/GFBE01005690.1/.p1 GENE.gb/GFBE01005690.1/~~gb/GFBE01005690.1/.p1  ORF type:complete len:358 (+),score=58.65 gb/GFBE01005690.1/:1-1074(+)